MIGANNSKRDSTPAWWKTKPSNKVGNELLAALKEVEKVPTHEIDFESILYIIQKAEAL